MNIIIQIVVRPVVRLAAQATAGVTAAGES